MKLNTVFLLTALLGSAAYAQGQVLAAGSTLTNQAQITGRTFEGPFSSVSNIVTTEVLPVCSINVTPNGTVSAPGQQVSILPTESTTLTYRVSNTGNQTTTFPLTVQQLAASTGSLSNLQIIPDSNGNGLADDQPSNAVTLNVGASQTVFVTAKGSTVGDSFVNLVASCGAGQPADDQNVARVTVGEPPAFGVTKEFDREILRPGDRTSVTVTLENRGSGTSRELWLTDDLTEQLAGGLTLVPDSVKTSAGRIEYTADGNIWQTQPTTPVRGIRIYQAQLAAGQRITLTFQLEASAQATGNFTNVARVNSSVAGGASAQDSIRVAYSPAVRIGPAGQPLAEGATDQQERAFALVSKPSDLCFDHTVRNTGDVSDTFTVSVSNFVTGGATATVPAPFTLEPGAERTVQVCYTNPQTGRLEANVVVTGSLGSSDPTTDVIGRVETALPLVEKSVSRPDRALREKERVETGQELLYTLRVRNPYATALDNVSVVDTLPAGVELIEATGAAVSGRQLTWQVGTLAAGAEQSYTVRVRVTATGDDEAITNVFKLVSSLFPEGVESNKATVYTWNSDPNITKTAQPAQVTIGDRVTYTITVRNTSQTGVLQEVKLYDDPSQGLQYVAGTSRLDKNAISDPTINAATGQMTWNLPDLAPNASATLTYEMLVTPTASTNLRNVAIVRAEGAEGATNLASDPSTANTQLVLATFAPVADILGTVFVDNDGDRIQGDGEAGVAGARVLLAGGRNAITDERGRYHFGNVPFGTHAVRLDPSSVNLPADTTDLTQTEHVRGLTTMHFPLPPEQSRVGRALPLQLEDAAGQLLLWPMNGGYQAEVLLTPTRSGTLALTGTLPQGAELLDGESAWSGTVQAGQNVRLTYRYRTAASADAALLQPLVEWKE